MTEENKSPENRETSETGAANNRAIPGASDQRELRRASNADVSQRRPPGPSRRGEVRPAEATSSDRLATEENQ
jgi:hypothetical protein